MDRDSATRRGTLRAAGITIAAGGIPSGRSRSADTGDPKVELHVDSPTDPPNSDKVEIPDDDIRYVEPDPDAGFHQPYLLYTPSRPFGNGTADERPLLVEPNARAVADFEIIVESAVNNITGGTPGRIADRMHVPIVYPLFPQPDRYGYVKMLDDTALTGEYVGSDGREEPVDDPAYERYDLQLIAMIDDVRERLADEPYEIGEKIRLNGFSSSGAFVTRFTILHPERVTAVSAGGIGAVTLPKELVDEEVPAIDAEENEPLPYPIGVADLEELIGRKFDEEAWKAVDKFLYVGDEDRPDPEEDPVSYRSFSNLPPDTQALLLDVFGTKQVEERFPVSKAVYQAVDPTAEFTIYDGYGHTDQPAESDIVEFHDREIDLLTIARYVLGRIPGISVGVVVSCIAVVGYLLRQHVTDDQSR